MIYQIIDLPRNLVGFKAAWDVTKKDFEEVVLPCVKKHVEKNGQINCLLVLNSSISNFSFSAWLTDVFLTLRNTCKWKRAAIVSDSKALKYFSGLLAFFVPGEFTLFTHDELNHAIEWLAEQTN